jgi:serine O-acetyltransferase
MGLVSDLVRDALSLARAHGEGQVTPRSIVGAMSCDGYAVLAMSRVRAFASRWHIPVVNRALRMAQMTVYNIEISKEARLGEGVNLNHTGGVIIGGDSLIGARTLLLGSITIGNLDNRGYPRIGEDVVIGAGARILGPITIGRGAKIGANAVVLSDVPEGATAVGIPAVVRVKERRTV